jgi:two-component system phosphate regulon sensor histidine kinase PhoR
MSPSGLTQRTFLAQFLWLLFVVAGLVATAYVLARNTVLDTHVEHTARTVAVAAAAAGLPAPGEQEAAERLAVELQQRLSAYRVTVFDATGNIRADVGTLGRDPYRFGLPVEYFSAMRRGIGTATRRLDDDSPVVVHVARAVADGDGRPALVIRVSHPREAVLAPLARSFLIVTYVATALLAATAVYIWTFVSRYAGSLGALAEATDAYARGDLQHRAVVELPDGALTAITRNLNEMAHRLSRRIADLTAERDELETILSNMVEGVILLDARTHIRSLNDAARRLFASPSDRSAEGRSLVEFTRNAEIDEFARSVLRSDSHLERTVAIYDQEIVYLQLHGSALLDVDGKPDGVVLVVSDVTRLKRLENIRRDFVANVSHELKTPITSILGFVESLRDGAVEEPERAKRFLGIIEDHAHRLNLIIEDLLSLSRIESQEREIEREVIEVGSLVDAVMEACGPLARHKDVSLYRECECSTDAYVNESLLQQAVTNLVDNAIKYSPTGASVGIELTRSNGELLISVHDDGPGIPKRDLPRIFERFYRVDRARSRALGGTGLGLSIVKHIAQAHGGSVEVESEVGRGSTFTIRLPQGDLDGRS